jgi:hypothetical protein
MTVLENSIRIDTTPDKVWSVLASLDALAKYDPGVSKAEIVSAAKDGPGAARRCDLTPGGWFKEARRGLAAQRGAVVRALRVLAPCAPSQTHLRSRQ